MAYHEVYDGSYLGMQGSEGAEPERDGTGGDIVLYMPISG
jgi:hypothetical protein